MNKSIIMNKQKDKKTKNSNKNQIIKKIENLQPLLTLIFVSLFLNSMYNNFCKVIFLCIFLFTILICMYLFQFYFVLMVHISLTNFETN